MQAFLAGVSYDCMELVKSAVDKLPDKRYIVNVFQSDMRLRKGYHLKSSEYCLMLASSFLIAE